MSAPLIQQNALYIAINLQNIMYGMELVLYFETVHAVLRLKKKKRPDIFLLLFSTVMLILVTIWVAATAFFGEEMWIVHGSKGPADADAYWASTLTRGGYLIMAWIAIWVLQLMTDALLIYRCRVVWDRTAVIILPLFFWLACLVFVVLQSCALIINSTGFPRNVSTYMTLSYYISSVVLNTTVTSLICYRIVRHGKQVRVELGHSPSSVYFAIVGITIESALLLTLSGILCLVTFGVGLQIMTPFAWVYFMMSSISPQMLILRILRNKSSPQDEGRSASSGSNIRFQHWSEVSARGADSLPESDEPKGTSPLAKVHLTNLEDSESTFASKKGA